MDLHEIANLFPPMMGLDYSNLKRSIEISGQRETIKIWNGAVIDGRHRLKACKELGIAPRFETFEGTETEAVSYVIALNLHRRQLADGQRSMIASRISTYRRENNLSAPPKVPNGTSGTTQQNQQVTDKTIKQAATELNVSERSVKRANQVNEKAIPAIVQAADEGRLKVASAEVIAKLPKDKQEKIAAAINEGAKPAEAVKTFWKPPKQTKPRVVDDSVPAYKVTPSVNRLEDMAASVLDLMRQMRGTPDEWRLLQDSINKTVDIIDKVGILIFERVDALEGVEVEEPEPLDEYADEPEPEPDVADGFDFGDEPRPNPYEYGD